MGASFLLRRKGGPPALRLPPCRRVLSHTFSARARAFGKPAREQVSRCGPMKRRYSTMVTDAPTPDEAEYWKPMERMRAVMAAGVQHRGPNARPGRAGPRGLSVTARLLLSYLATYAVDDGSLRHDAGEPLVLDELVEGAPGPRPGPGRPRAVEGRRARGRGRRRLPGADHGRGGMGVRGGCWHPPFALI